MTDEPLVPAAYRRMRRTIFALGILGGFGVAAWFGWRPGVSFAAGSVLAVANLWLLRRVVEAVGTDGSLPRLASRPLFALKIIAIGVAGFVIIRLTALHALAAILGLLTIAAAALGEAIRELLYARTRTVDHETLQ